MQTSMTLIHNKMAHLTEHPRNNQTCMEMFVSRSRHTMHITTPEPYTGMMIILLLTTVWRPVHYNLSCPFYQQFEICRIIPLVS